MRENKGISQGTLPGPSGDGKVTSGRRYYLKTTTEIKVRCIQTQVALIPSWLQISLIQTGSVLLSL